MGWSRFAKCSEYYLSYRDNKAQASAQIQVRAMHTGLARHRRTYWSSRARSPCVSSRAHFPLHHCRANQTHYGIPMLMPHPAALGTRTPIPHSSSPKPAQCENKRPWYKPLPAVASTRIRNNKCVDVFVFLRRAAL